MAASWRRGLEMRYAFIVLLLLAPAALAEDLAAGLKRCAAVTDSLQRLVCYDNLAKTANSAGVGGLTTPQAAVSNYTAPQQPRPAAVSGRCMATTKKGTQCSRNARAGSNYCWQHGG